MAEFAHDLDAQRRLREIERKMASGGPPTDNDEMEARLTKLEEFANDAKERLTRVETKLDHIDKEVSNFKWWVVAQIFAGLLTVVGTGIAIQQMTVSTFQAAGAQAQPTPQPPIIITVPQAVTPAALPPASSSVPTN